MHKWFLSVLTMLIALPAIGAGAALEPEIVHYRSGELTLRGELFKPAGAGPFPAVLYNHGSSRGMQSSEASRLIAPLFVAQGWVFFMPYRRGQGLNEHVGRYIGDELRAERRSGTAQAASALLVKLMSNEQLRDQMSALEWLRSQAFVQQSRVATAGNSYGGIQVVFGMANADYCTGIDASGGAESWTQSPELQDAMQAAVRKARAPIFFFQAQNDYNISPSVILADAMTHAGKSNRVRIYPPYGKSASEGHSFPYRSTEWFEDVFPFIERNCAR